MKKKALSLALALALCLSLTVPALAANQAGDTTITDANGTYTLSNPILYTFTQSDMAEINMDSMAIYVEEMEYDGDSSVYLDEFYWPRVGSVYAVPEGTVVTLPSNLVTWTVFDLDVTWENGNCHATEFSTINYPGFTSIPLNGAGYILTIELRNIDTGNSSASAGEGSGASGSAIDDGLAGAISFYVPKDGATANPFVTTTPTQPQQPTAETIASPTNDKLEVNGAAANPTVYKINGSNYFKIRDVAALLSGTEKQFAVGYDGSKNAVTATTGQGYDKQSGDLAGAPAGGDQSAAVSNDAIYVNGEKVTAEVYKIGGNNYFKLRDLGKALNFYVGWSAERGMYIETDKPYAE